MIEYKKRHICTYFDINFLPRGLALLDSLEKNSKNFTLYILALDDEVVDHFKALENKHVVLISINEYSRYFSIDRSKYQNQKEFYFSITAAICLYVFRHYEEIDILLYLDADVYLFNDLEIVYKEMGESSIAICSHRLPWYIKLVSTNYGIYNVGVNAFRNDEEGNRCLSQWHKECSEWIPNQPNYPLSYFSDQIWLDNWPKLYNQLKIMNHVGINVAPWNVIQYKVSKKEAEYYVDNQPLVIYHFSSLKDLGEGIWHGNTMFTILNIKHYLLDVYTEYIHNIEKHQYKNKGTLLGLKFSGSKLKIVLYKILKQFHNHTIIVSKEKKG